MDFLDEAFIIARSGDGGRGCVSFRREKYVPKGGPDGGDGGDGGGIILRATRKHHTLRDYRSRKLFQARNGEAGRGKSKTGRNGKDVFIEVPLGTIVYDSETDEVIGDLIQDKQEIFVLQGGMGGKGNQHFATSTNRTPRFAQPGLPGAEIRLRLSLKFLADIGIIGLPNAGKSTILSRLTESNPKIGSYPFTTLVPNLGVIAFEDEKTLTMADIPGLIEGASEGRGLGLHFLKHIERTKLLLHLIDITYASPNHLLEDFYILRNEMERYDPSLLQKDQIVLVNKVDIHSKDHRDVHEVINTLKDIGMEVLPVSALTGEGLEGLKRVLAGRFFND
jgi:GTP-binding protein